MLIPFSHGWSDEGEVELKLLTCEIEYEFTGEPPQIVQHNYKSMYYITRHARLCRV